MFHVVLYEPEIPANTGNLIRLAANSGCQLHLVRPLGFSLEEKAVRRAGLDYHELAELVVHDDWQAARRALAHLRWYAFTTRAARLYTEAGFREGDVMLFGPETRGLPEPVLAEFGAASRLRLPMQPGCRSLNLSNTVSVAVYEGWRQNGFAQSAARP
jgi:tRNA (cytidine/uridine-2'-O-)-methyltransferase